MSSSSSDRYRYHHRSCTSIVFKHISALSLIGLSLGSRHISIQTDDVHSCPTRIYYLILSGGWQAGQWSKKINDCPCKEFAALWVVELVAHPSLTSSWDSPLSNNMPARIDDIPTLPGLGSMWLTQEFPALFLYFLVAQFRYLQPDPCRGEFHARLATVTVLTRLAEVFWTGSSTPKWSNPFVFHLGRSVTIVREYPDLESDKLQQFFVCVSKRPFSHSM